MKKTTFFVRIFGISHCIFTQISIERAHWMQNSILHQQVPTLHTFDKLEYPKNKKYMKNHDNDIIITFF